MGLYGMLDHPRTTVRLGRRRDVRRLAGAHRSGGTLIGFGETRPCAGWRSIVVDALLLTVFALHHSVLRASPSKGALAHSFRRGCFARSTSGSRACLLILYATTVATGRRRRSIASTVGRRWIIAIVQIIGVWMIAQSVRAIDPLELAGIRNPKMTDEELQTGGRLALVRHPLYFGWLLIVFGAAHMTGDRLTFAVLTTSYLVIAMPWEERSLERTFGAAYRALHAPVRWRI